MKQPLISVVMPMYNQEKYIVKCLESVINQTLKELEIIVVNDGSTDSSLSIVKSYAEKDYNGTVTRKQLEVDFVCNLGSSRYYIQSAYTLPDEKKRTNEVRPFRKIDDSFKKIIITRDIVPPQYDEYGILTIIIYDFLLDSNCLEK